MSTGQRLAESRGKGSAKLAPVSGVPPCPGLLDTPNTVRGCGRAQPLVIIGDHQLDLTPASVGQRAQEVGPERLGHGGAGSDARHLALAIIIDRDGHSHGAAHDPATIARLPLAAPVRVSTSASMIRSAAKAGIARTRSPSARGSTSSSSAMRSSSSPSLVSSDATRTLAEDRRRPPATPPAARCATPGAPRAASLTNLWDTAAYHGCPPIRGRISWR